MTASEYEDRPGALGEKVELLVELLGVSRRTVLYTGAGMLHTWIQQNHDGREMKGTWDLRIEGWPYSWV